MLNASFLHVVLDFLEQWISSYTPVESIITNRKFCASFISPFTVLVVADRAFKSFILNSVRTKLCTIDYFPCRDASHVDKEIMGRFCIERITR